VYPQITLLKLVALFPSYIDYLLLAVYRQLLNYIWALYIGAILQLHVRVSVSR